MKNSFFISVVLASLYTAHSFAGGMGSVQPGCTWVGTLSAGPVWGRGGVGQTFYLAPEIEKTYVASRPTNTLFDGEVFIGRQKRLAQTMQGQLGLAVAATSNAKFLGDIWDDADPQFDNHIYRYNVQHTHVALKGKLLLSRSDWLTPWISGSVGVGFNRAHAFTNTPIIYEALPNPNFTNHTQTAFTYTVGAGVEKAIKAHWQVGVGYEFADWGKSTLGRADGQTLNSGLRLNHFYTNGVLFNLTYLA
jgi:opacity protein-like surface antigen